jgi:hypothetical protein
MATDKWTAHPLVFLSGAFAAGLTVATSIALPIYNTSQQNAYDLKVKQLEEQQSQRVKLIEQKYAEDKEGVSRVRELNRQNALLKAEISKALVDLYKVGTIKPFVAGNPIPVGFEMLKVGDPIKNVETFYPASSIEKDDLYYYVHLKGSFFKTLQVSYDDNYRISDVNYYVREGEEAKLVAAATAAFGKPEVERSRKGAYYTFKVKNGEPLAITGRMYTP